MEIVYSIILFYLGSTLTSFYQLIGYRLPQNQSIFGRSHCDHCYHQLTLFEVLPIIGYLTHLGKCSQCKKPIRINYIIFELTGGFLFVLTYLKFGFTLDLIVGLCLISVFLIETTSDIHFQIVIDRIWIFGSLIIIIVKIIQGTILSHLLYALILFSILFSIAYIGKLIAKKEALGGGDIKLYAFIGLTMSVWNGLLSLFLASVFALIYAIVFQKHKDNYIPLVPFIFIGVFIAYVYGNDLIDWYLNLFGM